MTDTSLTSRLDCFPCSFFQVGRVDVAPVALKLLIDDEIISAFKRHTHCDFGQVSWMHHTGNLELIAESRGVITSIYTSLAGGKLYIVTHLDEFDPHTRVFTA